MASDTSSDINSRLLEQNNGMKKETTETDLYLGLVANPSKILVDTPDSSSSLHYNNDDDKSSSSSDSDIKHNYLSSNSSEKIKKNTSNDKKSSKSFKHSKSNDSPDSSRAKYERVVITPDNSSKHTEVKPPSPPVLTPQQVRMKRIELLRKLSDIKSKGYKLSKEYDFNSSIEEMEYEYDLLKSFAERRNGIKLYKNTILNVSNIVEFFNNKYDPFGIKLDGWSEHMNVEIDSYDDVMEELYEKYKSSGKSMPPELKLLMLVVASASAFHFSKAYLTRMPGLDGIMNMQPELISKMVSNNQQSQFMTEQEMNVNRQKKEMQEREKQMKQQMRQPPPQQQYQPPQQQYQQPSQQQYQPPPQQQYQPPQQQYQPPPQKQFQNQSAEFTQASTVQSMIKSTPPQQEKYQPFHKSVNPDTPIGTPSQVIPSNDPRNILQKKPQGIKSSESVKDILSRLHSREIDTVETQDETSSVNNDRLISDTMTDSSSKSKRSKKKNIMQIF